MVLEPKPIVVSNQPDQSSRQEEYSGPTGTMVLPRERTMVSRKGGRACLTCITFVLKSGIPWEMLPAEKGCGQA